MESTAIGTASAVTKKLDFLSDIAIMGDVRRVLNNSKVSDHTALIPTSDFYYCSPDNIPDGEKKILFLIACRLVCALSAPYIYETVTSEIECNGFSFTVKGRNVIDEGFKAVERKFRDYYKVNDDGDEEKMPETSLSEGRTIQNVSSEISENYTQPPKHFTEDTLLSAMERAGTEDITEEVERSGLGRVIKQLTAMGGGGIMIV